MASKKGKSRLSKAEERVQSHLEEIDESISDLEKLLKPYERIRLAIDKLRAARRALVAESKAGPALRVRQRHVVEYLEAYPGSSAGQIAQALGVSQGTISTHLYRGKNTRFLTKNKKWWNINIEED